MRKFELTKQAKNSLKEIARYTQKKWGKEQRVTYISALYDQFHRLSEYPQKGRLRSDIYPEIRSYPQNKHIIYYLLKNNTLIIIDILHERMYPQKQ